MSRLKYTIKELIIVLFFISCGFIYRSCAALLDYKIDDIIRTIIGIREKLRSIKTLHLRLKDVNKEWSLDAVDIYIKCRDVSNL